MDVAPLPLVQGGMTATAQAAAAAGDVAFFTAMTDEQLLSALRMRDDDGRTLLHNASSNGVHCAVCYGVL